MPRRRPAEHLRFVGEICGICTSSGRRIVVGRWPTSPFGPIADAMVEDAAGHRTLVAPTSEIGEFIARVYEFDEVVVAAVNAERGGGSLTFHGGPLEVRATIGRRDPLGWLLRAVPGPLAASPAWCRVIDPIARVAMRGVRTVGHTTGGTEFYGASDRHAVVAVQVTWNGTDAGELAPVAPAVRFGFSSTPATPSLVAVTTTIHPKPISRR